MTWLLRLLPFSGDERGFPPERKVCGLTLALRMALAAQAGGASAVEVSPDAAFLVPLLKDARLGIPVRVSGSDEGASLRVDVPWNLVVHRDLLKDLAASGATGCATFWFAPMCSPPPSVSNPSSCETEVRVLALSGRCFGLFANRRTGGRRRI